MSQQKPKQRTLRQSRLERMEDRLVMSADPVGAIKIDYMVEAEISSQVSQQATSLAAAHALTGQNDVVDTYGFDGAGQTVAIIDSGIAWNHPALGNGFGANHKVVGGWDFAENDANPYDDGPMGSHGTHVAGIIGAEAGSNSGVATGADIVSLRVFDDEGNGYFSWVEEALQWVYDNRNTFANPITTVNLSLGAEWNANTIPNWATLENEFAQLESVGIFISVAAGNSFSSYNAAGLSYPAVSSYVVPVAAVDANGALASFSQRNERVIAAPGVSITSTVPDYVGNVNGKMDDWASYSGTSMAAPYLAGASMLLRQAMQFAGETNITQDDIYAVMYNTADWIYDSVTAKSYARLDLQAAIDSVMGADDHGSTIGAATNLGTIASTKNVNGTIGTLNDSDYFRFTASASGTVTINGNFNSTQPNWILNGGGGTVGNGGNSFTFSVQQGQSYTFGLTGANSLGKYSLSIKPSAAGFTWTEVGAITQKTLTGLNHASGDTWYNMTATRAGTLTIEALFAHAQGNVNLQLYDENLNLLASSASGTDNERIDFEALAGQTFFLKASGANSNVALRFTNLVTTTGNNVAVQGTNAADSISLRAGSSFELDINGVAYTFANSPSRHFDINAGGGNDAVAVYGGTGSESGALRAGELDFFGAGSNAYSAFVKSAENITVAGGGGLDTISMFDSAGSDVFKGYSSYATMTGTGFSNTASGFRQVNAYASSGNLDRAYLYGTAGADSFAGAAATSTLYGAGYCNSASGFAKIDVYGNGGDDQAILYGSTGSDSFVGRTTKSVLTTDSACFSLNDFSNVQVDGNGGNDFATLYDSAGNDRLATSFGRINLRGESYQMLLLGFRNLQVYSTGGMDTSSLYDSFRDDTLTAGPDSATFSNSWYSYTVTGFDVVNVYSRSGIDVAKLSGSTSYDTYVGNPDDGTLTGSGYVIYVNAFKCIQVDGKGGGDLAILNGTAAQETYTSTPQKGRFVGAGFEHNVWGFARTNVYSNGGQDQAIFKDDANYREILNGRSTYSSYAGNGYLDYVYGFSKVEATSTGGKDIVRMYDSPAIDTLKVSGQDAILSSTDFYVLARGFKSVYAVGLGTSEQDMLSKKATDFVFAQLGDW